MLAKRNAKMSKLIHAQQFKNTQTRILSSRSVINKMLHSYWDTKFLRKIKQNTHILALSFLFCLKTNAKDLILLIDHLKLFEWRIVTGQHDRQFYGTVCIPNKWMKEKKIESNRSTKKSNSPLKVRKKNGRGERWKYKNHASTRLCVVSTTTAPVFAPVYK